MADLLRMAKALPAFAAALDVHLVETSPVLMARQQATLAGMPATWHRGLESVPPGPTILIANEFLDALPIRQFIRSEAGWRERLVGIRDGALAFGLSRDPVPPGLVPEALRTASPGTLVEICPAFTSLAAALAARGAPLAALFIDYGHATSRGGETLQAVKAHRPVDPLAEPGEADLTAHVDFAAFATAVREAGLAAGPAVPSATCSSGWALRRGRSGSPARDPRPSTPCAPAWSASSTRLPPAWARCSRRSRLRATRPCWRGCRSSIDSPGRSRFRFHPCT